MQSNKTTIRAGFVLIGRNEGDRLKRCVQSILPHGLPIVYVDSGSTDDSIQFCERLGISVVNLDTATPFTAARARNAGASRLVELLPELDLIQFIDGDCQVAGSWVETATDFLRENPHHAAVCGRRREQFPDATIFNKLCDIEWNTPVGDAKSTGGDVMMRKSAFCEVGGFNEELIAGEEPELCFRLRQNGWRIFRMDAEMTLHDANITTVRQWWKRCKRSGYAAMKGAMLHGRSPERYYVAQTRRIAFWGGALPITVALLSSLSLPALWLLLAYPLQYMRLTHKGRSYGNAGSNWALFTLLGKFPEFAGLTQCIYQHLLERKAELIEYK